MLKKIKNSMEKYMFHTIVPSLSDSCCSDECYVFGYLDGYFDESVYMKYILTTINNKEKLEIYRSGFEKGEFDKKRDNVYEHDILKKEKIDWLKKLALYDALNNVEFRNLKKESLDVYNNYKQGTFSLKKMDFVNDSSVTRSKR